MAHCVACRFAERSCPGAPRLGGRGRGSGPAVWDGLGEDATAIRLAAENVEREVGGGPFGSAVFRRDTGSLVSVGVTR